MSPDTPTTFWDEATQSFNYMHEVLASELCPFDPRSESSETELDEATGRLRKGLRIAILSRNRRHLDPAELEDLISQAFVVILRLCRRRERFYTGSFKSVAFCYAERLTLDNYRREQAAKHGGGCVTSSIEELDHEPYESTQQSSLRSDILIEADRLFKTGKINPRAWKAFTSVFVEGMSIAEVAVALGACRTTITSDLNKVQSLLKEEFVLKQS